MNTRASKGYWKSFNALALCLVSVTGCATGPGASDDAAPVTPMLVLSGRPIRADGQTLHARGVEEFHAGRYGLAVESFRAALALMPGSVDTLNGLAACYDQLKRFDLADIYYRRAIAVDPSSLVTLNNIGWSYHMRGQTELARIYLDQAHAIAPSHPLVNANLGMLPTPKPEPAKSEMAGGGIDDLSEPQNSMPAVWIERTSASVQTLVTAYRMRPDDPLLSAGLHPALVNVDRSAPGAPASGRSLTGMEPVAAPRVPVVQVEIGAASAPEVVREVPHSSIALVSAPEVVKAVAHSNIDAVASHPAHPPFIEVSNGAGRNGMAALMRGYLGQQAIGVRRLTNDASFGHTQSTLFYRPGFEEAAMRLASTLPIAVEHRLDPMQRSDIRLLLGADLLNFDATLSR